MTTDHTFVATVVGIILLGTPLEFRHGDLDLGQATVIT